MTATERSVNKKKFNKYIDLFKDKLLGNGQPIDGQPRRPMVYRDMAGRTLGRVEFRELPRAHKRYFIVEYRA